jgi:hypothetical protein
LSNTDHNKWFDFSNLFEFTQQINESWIKFILKFKSSKFERWKFLIQSY